MVALWRFIKKRDWTVQVSKVMDETAALTYGAIIPYEDVEKWTGVEKGSIHWYSLTNKIKRRFLEARSIVLETLSNVGYRLLTPQQQITEYPEKMRRLADKRIRKAAMAVGCIPDDRLNQDEQRYRDAIGVQFVEAATLNKKHAALSAGWKSSNYKTLPAVPRQEKRALSEA